MHPVYMRVDKLALVSAAESQENEEKLKNSMKQLKGDNLYSAGPNIKGSDHYRHKVAIRSKELPNATLSIEYSPYIKELGYIRLELSPQQFGPKGINQLISWLANKNQIGNRIYRILEEAWVTRVDCAVDLIGHSLNDYILDLDGARTGKTYTSDDDFPGYRLGAARSALCVSNYDKCYVNGKITKPDKDGLISLDAIDHERFTRIEARIKPDNKNCKLSNLIFLENPLKKLHFYNRDLISDSRLPPPFSSALKQMTVLEAWDYITGDTKERRNARNRIKRVFKQYEIPFIDVDDIWTHWGESIEQLGVLGLPTQWSKKYRQKMDV
jgi:hypothetical protein